MAAILNLETATTNCSVGLAVKGELVALREDNSPNYSHSEQLHLLIEECLNEAGLSNSDLDAIAVSKGPGSYTGLRIGVSAAKGLCYALDLPLISVDTLESMARQLAVEEGYIIPLIDARRMEVYAAVFDHQYRTVKSTRAEIINEQSFGEFVERMPVYLIGNGVEKCREVLQHPHFHLDANAIPSASEMASMSYELFKMEKFENTAYFEPFYLKDFIVTKPKK